MNDKYKDIEDPVECGRLRQRDKIAKNLIFSGLSDDEIMRVCQVDKSLLHELVAEGAQETRDQLMKLRFVLLHFRKDGLSLEKQQEYAVDALVILKEVLHFWEVSKSERQDILSICRERDERDLQYMLESLSVRMPDYLLLAQGAVILNKFYADMSYSRYRSND